MTSKQRLRVLAKYLLSGAVDEERFDMSSWPSCAIGEASRVPSLQKEGLEITGDDWSGYQPEYNGYSSFEACARFFGITQSQAKDVFGSVARPAVKVGHQLLKFLK